MSEYFEVQDEIPYSCSKVQDAENRTPVVAEQPCSTRNNK